MSKFTLTINLLAILTLVLLPIDLIAKEEKIQWNYLGNTGPENWGNLSKKYALCNQGERQSPINIVSPFSAKKSVLDLNYSDFKLSMINTHHTIKIDVNSQAQELQVNGEKYSLLQVHIHSPSEHIIDGKSFPLELHLVHQNASGGLAVVGVMFELGTESDGLKFWIPHLPKNVGSKSQQVTVELNKFLPKNLSYYHYQGSLTTPPCSEGVQWYVLQHHITASAAQIKALKDIMGENNRPVLPLNKRTIVKADT